MGKKLLDAVAERLESPGSVLQALWDLREAYYPKWKDFATAFAVSRDLQQLFPLVLIDNLERAKRANTERAVVKNRVLEQLDEELRDVVFHFVRKRDPESFARLDGIFANLIHYDPNDPEPVRVPVWERAYRVPSAGTGQLDLVSVRADEDESIVGSRGQPWRRYLDFDLWIQQDQGKPRACKAYLDGMKELGAGLTPCLVQKYAGAKGPILLLDEFATEYDNEMLVYSQTTGTVRRLKGTGVLHRDVCVFADIVVTGDSLRRARRDMEKAGYNVKAAVALTAEEQDLAGMEILSLYPWIPAKLSEAKKLTFEPIYTAEELCGAHPVEIVTSPSSEAESQIASDLALWRERGEEYRRKHNGMWVGIGNGEFLAARSLAQLYRRAREKEICLSLTEYVDRDFEAHAL